MLHVCRMLYSVCCLSLVVYCVLSCGCLLDVVCVVRCLLGACLMFVVRHVFFVVYCVLLVVCCLLFAVR